MKFCEDHWAKLRAAIDDRGLTALVPVNREEVASNIASRDRLGVTVDNFDPLMTAHNAIWNMAVEKIGDQYAQNSLMLMADPDAHPDWVCPICALNWCHAEHLRTCTKEGCGYPDPWDWTDDMINGASDFVLEEWRKVVKIR